MERITFRYEASTKKKEVTLRYRLRDGRGVQLYHNTDYKAAVADLEKFNPNGTTKGRISVYNESLAKVLKREYDAMMAAYALMCDQGLDLTTEVFEREISGILNPIEQVRTDNPSVVARFRKYANDAARSGIIGPNRCKHIIVVSDKLERFLVINGISAFTPQEFTEEHLMDFRNFIFDEYKYVTRFPKLYKSVKEQNRPSERLSMNTVASQMKMLQTFFTEIENTDEINKSPFRKLGKEKKKAVMKTLYDDPFFLRKEELQKVIRTEVPKNMQDVKDAFLVQCALGARVSDFAAMTLDSIKVSDEGIPYVHYIPQKTVGTLATNEEIRTPLVRFAFDIIKRTGFTFPILGNVFGHCGYNAKIKALLHICKIDREVAQFNEVTRQNDYLPLYSVASSKLCRKTHVDIMNKVQIDIYAAGLHKKGSSAVNRYTLLEIRDRFALMNAAFGQEPYKVNNKLEIAGEYLMAYDYRQDQEIAEAAEKFDKLCGHKAFDDIAENCETIPCAFYDEAIIQSILSSRNGVAGSPVLNSIFRFTEVMNLLFGHYHKMDIRPANEMEEIAKGLLIQLFEKYSSDIEAHFGEDYAQVETWILKWRDLTIRSLELVYESVPASEDLYKHYQDNRRMLRQAVRTAVHICGEFLEARTYSDLHLVSGIIPYNYWGKDYEEKMAGVNKGVRSDADDLAATNVLYNKVWFTDRYVEHLSGIVAVAGDIDKANAEISRTGKEIEALFSAYTKLLRRHCVCSADILRKAAEYWTNLTKTIIQTETYIYGQDFRLADYRPGDIIHSDVFRSSKKTEWDAIHALQTQMLLVLDGNTRLYVEGLSKGPDVFEWTDDLTKMKIKYQKLYDYMKKNRYFTDALPYDIFFDCIQRADVREIQEALINPERNASALRYLVRAIGHESESWYAAAAVTLRDSQDNPYTRNKLDKVSNVTEATCEMSEILPKVMMLTKRKGSVK